MRDVAAIMVAGLVALLVWRTLAAAGAERDPAIIPDWDVMPPKRDGSPLARYSRAPITVHDAMELMN